MVCSSGAKSPPPIIEDNWIYGGGYGYPSIVDPAGDGVVTVRTLPDLRNAVEAPNATVYVEDGAEIDLTGTELCLAEGVTLAGGRGREVGGHSPGTPRSSSHWVEAAKSQRETDFLAIIQRNLNFFTTNM